MPRSSRHDRCCHSKTISKGRDWQQVGLPQMNFIELDPAIFIDILMCAFILVCMSIVNQNAFEIHSSSCHTLFPYPPSASLNISYKITQRYSWFNITLCLDSAVIIYVNLLSSTVVSSPRIRFTLSFFFYKCRNRDSHLEARPLRATSHCRDHRSIDIYIEPFSLSSRGYASMV